MEQEIFNEKIVLYEEQATAWRYEGKLVHEFSKITIPTSLILLGVHFVHQDFPLQLSVIGGVFLMFFWGFYCQIMNEKSHIRFHIMKKLENYIDIEAWGHKKYTELRGKNYVIFSEHFLRTVIYFLYNALSFFILMIYYFKCSHDCIKLIVSIFVALLIFICSIVVWWGYCKQKETFNRLNCNKEGDLKC